jgi:endoribonuclease Dicer
VLVATSAVEEGIDVPLCSLVVRYNPAATGQQQVQSKGRARDLASTYVTLLDDASKDWGCSSMALDQQKLHARSEVQEKNMKLVVQQLAA